MRNITTLLLGTIGLIALIIIFLLSPNFIFSLVTPNINLENENFEKLYLNQNIKALPDDEISKDELNPTFYYLTNGMRVIADDNGFIKNIAITHDTDKTVKTSRGISVSDSLDTVKRYYGEDYYNRHEQGVGIIVYEDKNKFIEFWHWRNEVQEIRFGYKGNN